MINNPKAFMAGLWNWDILKGCFGTNKIRPTDIDGCVERNGHTLVIEAKGPKVPLPVGQLLMFEAWAKTCYFTVIVVWGNPDLPEAMMVFMPGGEIRPKEPIDLAGFRKFTTEWYKWADAQKRTGR